MHPYGIDTEQRRNVIVGFIVLSFILAGGVRALLAWAGLDYPELYELVIDPASAAGCFSLLVIANEKGLWRRWLFRKLFFITMPDLNGTWTGALYSSYGDPSAAHPITLTIRQEWSRIAIHLDYEGSSSSDSDTASIFLDKSTTTRLVYTYLNEPEPHQIGTMQAHSGTTMLDVDFSSVQDTLKGKYYTGRGRGTYGSMTLTRVRS